MYDELIKALRETDFSDGCPCKADPMCASADCIILQAVDAIEELANKLCDWCGVCPKERRSPWDCEIMWPDAPIPEVCIEPTKEETK